MFPRDFEVDADAWPPLRTRVEAETLGGYSKYRKTLTPRFETVWRDIALGYAVLAAIVVAVGSVGGIVASLVAATLGAVGIGTSIAYLQLFIHEAAHANLAPRRRTSDWIANSFIAWQVGTSIAAYRAVHFDHHRHLGHARDGERSYVHPLTPRLIVEMLTGVHAVRIFLSRAQSPQPRSARSKLPLIRGAAIHVAILGTMLAFGAWPAVLAWGGGMTIVYPFLATLRPLLEHRPVRADALRPAQSGAVTRLFADGPLAKIFGGAGFSRHLLHHWEPQVSYTRLAELDAYLARTSLAPILDARRTTYVQAFRDILANDRGR
ncbi:Fatty acid desaturase domain-containing protein [Sphingomonas antarctica]|uniref:fatty acid desaturase family protein n=1 Tax=Sphingomonas antarctica TaxID=2040274 RepID=UPI0039EA7646